jgi:predicted amidohydrolase YtcJ
MISATSPEQMTMRLPSMLRSVRPLMLVAVLVTAALPACSRPKTNDGQLTMAIVNARVWTGNPKQPWAEAIALRGDRIAIVGSNAEVKKAIGLLQAVDADGQMVTPGFIDSHVHFMSGGYQLASVQLRDAKTPAEFIKRIRDFAATVPSGTWITGGDWDHQLWGGELPRHEWIDSVTPNNPVFISRLDGHMILANALAMKQAKVSSATKEVSGGTIVRDASGAPTGIFKDNAQDVIGSVMPDATPEMNDRALEAAMKYVAEQGVTSVAHMGTWGDLAVFERAHKAGTLRTRISAAVPLATWEKLRDTVAARGRGDDWLHIGGLKGFEDGSLGSHTAAFLEPYTDVPTDTGLFVTKSEDLYAWTSGADKAGLQVMVHSIGDRAIRNQLDIFERVARENGARDRRFRIEHAQHIAPADIPRFAKLDVIASMQPYHAIDDGRWAEKSIGHKRAETTYAFKSLLTSGARLAFGSDWDVAPPIPLYGIYAAVTRRTLDDKNPDGWIPEQKIGVEDALRAYTSGGAYAMFAEQTRGTLEKGKLADLVMIDHDLTRIPPETIRDAHVVLTVVGGKIVYERKPSGG